MSWMSIPAKKYHNTPKNAKKQQPKKHNKMSAKEGSVSTFSLPGGGARPLSPCQLRHWV